MERHVKERLVGAAVLMAAAIILIPEMLSGPGDEASEEPAATSANAGDAPLKTYTIDLNAKPGAEAPPPETAANSRAPPPEMSSGDVEADVRQEEASEAVAARTDPPSVQANAESPAATVAREPVAPPVRAETAPARPAPTQAAAPLASTPAAPRSRAWAVQIGSFSKESTAQSMVQSLRTDGVDAFVMPVKSASGTLYRVRVGPMQERAAADTVARRLKPQFASATVVAHP